MEQQEYSAIYAISGNAKAEKEFYRDFICAWLGYKQDQDRYLTAILPADRSYITVEPDQTAESYTTGLRKKYITALVLAGVYVLLYVAAWCVTGGMKRRTGQI